MWVQRGHVNHCKHLAESEKRGIGTWCTLLNVDNGRHTRNCNLGGSEAKLSYRFFASIEGYEI